MLLITLDFWTYVLFAIYAAVLVLAYRFIWLLASFSEGFIISLARTGLHSTAKTMLSLLISYDERTYLKSRFTLWNQVRVRFALLWTGLLMAALATYAVKSWGILLAFLLVGVLYWWWTQIAKQPTEPFQKKSIQDVNERLNWGYQQHQPHVRQISQWDYLDELFA